MLRASLRGRLSKSGAVLLKSGVKSAASRRCFCTPRPERELRKEHTPEELEKLSQEAAAERRGYHYRVSTDAESSTLFQKYNGVVKHGRVPRNPNTYSVRRRNNVVVRDMNMSLRKLGSAEADVVSALMEYQSFQMLETVSYDAIRQLMKSAPPDVLQSSVVLPRLCRILMHLHTPQALLLKPFFRSEKERHAANKKIVDLQSCLKALRLCLEEQQQPFHGDVSIYLLGLSITEPPEFCHEELRHFMAKVDFKRGRHYSAVAYAYMQANRLTDIIDLYREAKAVSVANKMMENVQRPLDQYCMHGHPGFGCSLLFLLRHRDEAQSVSPYPPEAAASIMRDIPQRIADIKAAMWGTAKIGPNGEHKKVAFRSPLSPPELLPQADPSPSWNFQTEPVDVESADWRRNFFFNELLEQMVLYKTDCTSLFADALKHYFDGPFKVSTSILSRDGVCDHCNTQLEYDHMSVEEMQALHAGLEKYFMPALAQYSVPLSSYRTAAAEHDYDCVFDVSNTYFSNRRVDSTTVYRCWEMMKQFGYRSPLMVISRRSIIEGMVADLTNSFPTLIINRGPRFLDDIIVLLLASSATAAGRDCVMVSRDLHHDKLYAIPALQRYNFRRFVISHSVEFVPDEMDPRRNSIRPMGRVKGQQRHISENSIHLSMGSQELSGTYQDQFVCISRRKPCQ